MATSKKLSYLLRHSEHPSIDGWIPVPFLIANYGFSRKGLQNIVEHDEKQRCEFSEEQDKVRARYGHTNHVHIHYEPSVPPAKLYHGTSQKSVERIMSEGLKKMSRQYVHLSETIENAVKVGSRHGNPVVIEVNAQKMAENGHLFYSVDPCAIWLTDDIAPKYLQINPIFV